MRLIDADRFLVQIEDQYMEHDLTRSDYLDIEDRILQQPTIDAVEVVRCKDCRYYGKHPTWSACTYWSGDPYEQATVDDNDFCSYGERREP